MMDERVRELVEAAKEMARTCGLQNWEQISDPRGARGAVSMIQREYLSLREMSVSSPAEIRKGDTSMTYGDLHQKVPSVAASIEPHIWDNMNISEQRDWVLRELEARIAELEGSGWIDVKQELPIKSGFVLACDRSNRIVERYWYNAPDKNFSSPINHIERVTDWQYLPKPPAELEGKQ